MKDLLRIAAAVMVIFGCGLAAAAGETPGASASQPVLADRLRHTAAELLSLTARPIVIGHEGAGENFGENPNKPINDTIESVRLAFQQGASVVEVDVELTKDKQVVSYHDNDFLPDFTCINSLSLDELHAKVPYIPTLE